jgi:malonyl-CoA/methylmalonyl-CoA synthetase
MQTFADASDDQPLFAVLAGRWQAHATKPALVTPAGEILTYAGLDAAVACHAGLLRELGVRPGDRVAVHVEKSPQALILYLACLKAGAVYLPLNSAYREGEVDHFLGDAEPVLFLHRPCDEEWAERLCRKHGVAHRFEMAAEGDGVTRSAAEPRNPRASWAGNALNAAPMLEFVPRAAHDPAAILYTSGTTGRSKGALLTQRNLASNARVLHACWGFRPDDVLLHVLPLFHVHGLFVAGNTALINASTMLFHPRFDAKAVIADMRRATLFMGVPTMYTRLLAEPAFDRAACAHMRLFISGSAPLSAETSDAFELRTGHTILERYGMTETGMITSNPLTGERRRGSVGPALPGVGVRVVDDAGRECASDAIGHVQVKGPNVLAGYWRMPEQSRAEFTADGWFKTGDLGKFDADRYLTLVGRSKDLVISGGYNVYPKEVESLVDEVPGVAESAVIGLPHPDFGEAVAAVVVAAPGAVLEEAALIASLKSRLAAFKVPKRVFVVDALPRNAMGKVQKNELRRMFAATFTAS